MASATVIAALVTGDAARAFDGADKAATVSVKPLEIFKNPRQALQSALESYNAGHPASVDALKYAAAGGESLARWKLALMYAYGDGVPAQRARGLMWMALAREGAAGKTQDWIQAQYEKAIGVANDNDRQAALVYLEDHVKRRY